MEPTEQAKEAGDREQAEASCMEINGRHRRHETLLIIGSAQGRKTTQTGTNPDHNLPR